MSNKRNQRKLKNYLIKKDVQLKLICINLLYMFFVTLITIAVVLSPIISLMYQSDSLDVQYQAAKFFMLIFERLPLVLGAVFILVFIHQLLITHQVCGPLVNFANTIKRITKGDLTRKIYLRRYDFLKEDGQCINEMIDVLSHIIGDTKEDHKKLLSALNEVTIKTTGSDEHQKSEEALKTAVKQAQVISEHLSIFKLVVNDKEKPSD